MTNKQVVLNKVKQLINEGNTIFPHAKLDYCNIDIRFTLRGKTAGKARTKPDFGLYFHPQLMERDLNGYMSTVEHEVAHLFQRKIYPYSQPHGKEFKMVARKLGNDASRCHTMNTSGIGRPKQRFVYRCPNGCKDDYLLTSYKHNIQQTSHEYNSGRFYICSKCNARLLWTGNETIIR